MAKQIRTQGYKERQALKKQAQRDADPERYAEQKRSSSLKTNYGITGAEYQKMYLSQGGRCAICGTTTFGGPGRCLHVDHCHTTRRVRGLLCRDCNLALGWFKDDIERLGSAIAYLEDFNG